MTRKQILKRLQKAGYNEVKEAIPYFDEHYAIKFSNDFVNFRLAKLKDKSKEPYRLIKEGFQHTDTFRGHAEVTKWADYSSFGIECELGIGE